LRYKTAYFLLKLYICTMNKILSPKKLFLLLGFIFSLQSFASFVDNGSAKKSSTPDISLKTFSKNFYKNTAYPNFRLSKFQYKGSSNLYQKNSTNSVEGQSFIRMGNGNTTYLYPYKYKVKTSFFKTPTPQGTH
jgi:hypothetical protein